MTVLNIQGKGLNVSVSAREDFHSCIPKWYFGYVLRERGEKGAAAQLGNDAHDLAEGLLKGDLDPEVFAGYETKPARLVRAGLPFLPWVEYGGLQPLPMPKGWSAEPWVRGVTPTLPFIGKIDFWTPSWGFGLGDKPVIGDWKTSSNPKAWLPNNAAELMAHPQMPSYAMALHLDSSLPEVDMTNGVHMLHIQIKTKGRPSPRAIWAIDVPFSRLEAEWEQVESDAAKMAVIATQQPHPRELPPPLTDEPCEKYGGCQHAEYCPFSPQNRAQNILMTSNQNEAIDDIFGDAPPPKPKAAAPPRPPISGRAINASDLTLQAAATQLRTVMKSLPNPPKPLIEQLAKRAGVAADVLLAETNGTTRPEARNKPAAAEDQPIKTSREPLTEVAPRAQRDRPPLGTGYGSTDSCSAGEGPPTATLYVDCLPLNVPTVALTDILRPFLSAGAKAHKAVHWSAVGFGKGRGTVCALVASAVDKHGVGNLLGNQAVVVSRSWPLYGDVVEGILLATGFDDVVLGTR